MSVFAEIPVPQDFEAYDGHSRVLYFRNALGSVHDIGELASALDLGCDPPNTRASLDSVTIEQVSIHADEIRIEYAVAMTEFQACKSLQALLIRPAFVLHHILQKHSAQQTLRFLLF